MSSIFTFSSSREYLRAYIDSLPKKGWGEIQRWSEQLGVQTSYISQVLSGSKNFNTEYALRLGKYIGLVGMELDFFILMIEKERAGTVEAQDYFASKMNAMKKDSRSLSNRVVKDRALTDEEMTIFYSSWMYSAIRLYCSVSGGRTIHQISEYFDVPKEECSQIMTFLVGSGFCTKKGEKYQMGTQKTHVDRKSPHVRRHWMNWHVKGLTRFENLDESELIYSAPFSISRKDFEILREDLAVFIKKFVEKVGNTEPEEVAFLNIDLLKVRN